MWIFDFGFERKNIYYHVIYYIKKIQLFYINELAR